MNARHELMPVCASALRRCPDVATLRAAPTEMSRGVPSKSADEDSLIAATFQAAFARWLLSCVLGELGPIRHREAEYTETPVTFCTEMQYGGLCRTKVLPTKVLV